MGTKSAETWGSVGFTPDRPAKPEGCSINERK